MSKRYRAAGVAWRPVVRPAGAERGVVESRLKMRTKIMFANLKIDRGTAAGKRKLCTQQKPLLVLVESAILARERLPLLTKSQPTHVLVDYFPPGIFLF